MLENWAEEKYSSFPGKQLNNRRRTHEQKKQLPRCGRVSAGRARIRTDQQNGGAIGSSMEGFHLARGCNESLKPLAPHRG